MTSNPTLRIFLNLQSHLKCRETTPKSRVDFYRADCRIYKRRNEITQAENPWIGAQKFRTKTRDRFLNPDELNRFFSALNEIKGTDLYDYVQISLFTGARRSNVLAMKWEDIDFTFDTWRIPETKSGDVQVIPLTANLKELLETRRYVENLCFLVAARLATSLS